MVRKVLAALACAALSVGAAGATTNATATKAAVKAPAPVDYFARDTFKAETIVCPFRGTIQYKPGEISCGLLTVPENREKPASRMIQLHFVKLSARKPALWDAKKQGEWKRREDPIVYLTGGPGVTVTGYANRLKDHGARDVRDVYILEQRGIGYSDDFCPMFGLLDPKATNALDWESAQAAQIKIVEECFKAAAAKGVDLTGYNTIENARDVEALRRALGFDKWNVWGISYGSYLGQAYLRQDPAGVRAAVIDAIVPFEQNVQFLRVVSHYDRDLKLLQKACDADKICAAHFAKSQARLEQAIAAVKKDPIVIDDAIDKESFPTGKAVLFHNIIAGLPFQALYEQKNYATLPAVIDALATMVEKRDFAGLRALTAQQPIETGGDAFISNGMYNAIACNDGWTAGLEAAVKQDLAEFPKLASFQGDPKYAAESAAACVRNGMPPRDAAWYEPLVTDIPMIVADGQMDPITPPPLAKAILPGLKNGTYVEFPYAGHGPTRSVKCAGEFLTKFFDAPTAKVDTKCADDMKAPAFTGPLFATQGHLKLAAMLAAKPESAAMVAAWAVVPALILLIGSLIYNAAPIARFVNSATGYAAAPTGGARTLAWLVSLAGAASVVGLGAAFALSSAANEFMVLVGLLGWAKWFAWAGIAAGALGAALLVLTFVARAREPLPIGTLLGLFLTAVSGLAWATFLWHWGFAPF